jgi:hypothetical protein
VPANSKPSSILYYLEKIFYNALRRRDRAPRSKGWLSCGAPQSSQLDQTPVSQPAPHKLHPFGSRPTGMSGPRVATRAPARPQAGPRGPPAPPGVQVSRSLRLDRNRPSVAAKLHPCRPRSTKSAGIPATSGHPRSRPTASAATKRASQPPGGRPCFICARRGCMRRALKARPPEPCDLVIFVIFANFKY